MKFKFYDILTQIVPGFIIYLTYLKFKTVSFESDFVVPAIAISFVVGYFVNTISSWVEGFYYWTWGGKPSNQLLDGNGLRKIQFYEWKETKKLLQEEYTMPAPSNDSLFSIALRYATPEVSSRVVDFNSSYAFSRVMLTTILIVSGFFIFKYYNSYKIYLITAPLIFISWYRAKQRGYYYAKEVLNTYFRVKQKTNEEK